ncbi:hypothetical protein M426DRAFT_321109 [Hypoxylon sp. CI-4A]|nr:hypothetical protein M426DRAFT_321109 [Hypoxylon sp. CI-4A]
MAQVIENLQGRLARAEAQIMAQQSSNNSSNNSSRRSSSYSTPIFEEPPPLDFQYQLPLIPGTSHTDTNTDFHDLSPSIHDSDATNDDFFRSLENINPDLTQCQPRAPESSPISPLSPLLAPSMDGFQDFNETNILGSSIISDMPYSTDNRDSRQVLSVFSDLLSSMFTTQADIAGLSSVISEYLVWARKTCGSTETSRILGTLEVRMREINHMASTRHWVAFKEMHESASTTLPVQSHLKRMEMDLMEKTMKAMEPFHGNYDICSPLTEQRYH